MVSLGLHILATAVSFSLHATARQSLQGVNFPDPSVTFDPHTSRWFAFATQGNDKNDQVATSADLYGERSLFTNLGLLPVPDSSHHCIGVATSPNITGPYTARNHPFACPLSEGGAIDASGFFDQQSRSRWVVYKVDGSSKGTGGHCGNGDPPGFDTPIMMQRVSSEDGITPLDVPVAILHRDADLDGPLVEAPSLIRHGVGRAAVYAVLLVPLLQLP
ncbi:glycosyl hydrolase [Cercophora newfieldiana]|uniref:Glycosyl hydrolase n=1 Tax=Cercophora newfieldiana TaxID=92897 RepID=A0AA39YSE1_9PEZI|nr:glycosyl hydrolase [Cercophora newfieldiana]